MDGLAEKFGSLSTLGSAALSAIRRQRTLRHPIHACGVGLHSGLDIVLKLLPADSNHGIWLRRADLGVEYPARYDLVQDTRLCTLLHAPGKPDSRIGTVEHVMAALAAVGITNAIIEVDGPEIPVFDGSAEQFLFLIDCAGILEQVETAPVIEVLRPVRVCEGESFAELLPSGRGGFSMDVSIDFSATVIGRQAMQLDLTPEGFRHELCTARTFALAHEIESLRLAGLARGGSLENALVVDGSRVLNPEGLRSPDEFVRHKMLDVVGDLFLAGAALHAHFRAHRPGHALNNKLLRTLFADRANYATEYGTLPQAA